MRHWGRTCFAVFMASRRPGRRWLMAENIPILQRWTCGCKYRRSINRIRTRPLKITHLAKIGLDSYLFFRFQIFAHEQGIRSQHRNRPPLPGTPLCIHTAANQTDGERHDAFDGSKWSAHAGGRHRWRRSSLHPDGRLSAHR